MSPQKVTFGRCWTMKLPHNHKKSTLFRVIPLQLKKARYFTPTAAYILHKVFKNTAQTNKSGIRTRCCMWRTMQVLLNLTSSSYVPVTWPTSDRWLAGRTWHVTSTTWHVSCLAGTHYKPSCHALFFSLVLACSARLPIGGKMSSDWLLSLNGAIWLVHLTAEFLTIHERGWLYTRPSPELWQLNF